MSASADRNLLFGILAVQLDFVSRDALIGAMNAWLLHKSRPLGVILREQGQLSAECLQLLAALVAEHLKQHGNDPQQSLAALSSIDPAVRQKLQSIADPDVRASMAAAPGSGPNAVSTADLPLSPSSRYEILRPHARGGLGEVFVAEDHELNREVALKEILATHADDPDNRSRFLLEAKITGGLEHPGVVPVYGLGAYADGRPFYAMRFVKGDNLQQAIRRFHGVVGGVSVSERDAGPTALAHGSVHFDSLEFRGLLRRFTDVCNAIAYAHSRGVLHRDLKPGNVMLGKYGETLVVDWGLAKIVGRGAASDTETRHEEPTLRPHSGSRSSATRFGKALGTPAYMSPEQAAGRWNDLGPATDVYSLGATLYELLTGRVAFSDTDLDAVQKGLFPPPRQLRPRVPRPLEAVCLKAMSLRPADRYATAQALAADIEQWLADEPVTAFAEPLAARARRWMRKHAGLATGLSAAVAVGMVALAALAWQQHRAREALAAEQAETARERDKTAAERDRALAARKRTREALDAMVSGVTGESLATQNAISEEQQTFLRSVLGYYEEFAAEQGEGREGRERLAKAHLRLGMIRVRLEQREEGSGVFARAAELYTRLAADFPAVPEYRRDLGRCYNNLGLLLAELGKRREAEGAYRAALATKEKLTADFPGVPEYCQELAHSHTNLGILLAELGNRPEAEAAYRAALAIKEKLTADFPIVAEYRNDLATSHHNLGLLLAELGKRTEAEAAYRAALAIFEKLAADFPAVPAYRQGLAASHNSLGNLLQRLGKRPEAEAAFRAALVVQEKLAADFPAVPEYRLDLAKSHNNLGNLLLSQGKRTEAETVYRAALAIIEKLVADFPAVPEYRQQLARIHRNLGLLLADVRKWADAETAYRTALAVQEKLAADFPAVPAYRQGLAASHNNLARVLAMLGKRSEAEAAFRAALPIREKLAADFPGVPAYARDVIDSRYRLADLLARAGDHASAAAEAERLAGAKDVTAGALYDAACVFALSSAAAKADAALTDRYVARAVALLRQAFAEGYSDMRQMLNDSDLRAIRSRPDYIDLLWELAEGPAPAGQSP